MLALIGYLIADLAVRILPAEAADRLALGLARLVFALRPPARRALELNLARLVPRAPAGAVRTAARQAFEHFAHSLADFLRLDRLAAPALLDAIEIRGGRHLSAARAAGRGVIVLSAHAGNWEWGAAYLAASGPRLHLIARPHPSRWVEAFFARRRARRGVGRLPGGPFWVHAARALRRREWVGLMADRGSGAAGGSVCAWAAALARRTGAIVLPAIMVRLAPGRYAACFEPHLTPEECLNGAFEGAMRRTLERDPGQWLAFEPLPEGLA